MSLGAGHGVCLVLMARLLLLYREVAGEVGIVCDKAEGRRLHHCDAAIGDTVTWGSSVVCYCYYKVAIGRSHLDIPSKEG